jgi:hypothetical protein
MEKTMVKIRRVWRVSALMAAALAVTGAVAFGAAAVAGAVAAHPAVPHHTLADDGVLNSED